MISLELLSSALTIVIGDTIYKPEVEREDGSIKIIYKLSTVTITELSTIFEIEHCMRLDFFVDKIRLKIKHQIYNSLSVG
ncbi:hypothetical protein [Veillonella parvula]|jgi:hypothetical protein|uniref:hypothetical protein n=1 Tax=Veillonella parvula TaxID=29466 RepID=UPI00241E9D3C|nr:hypothetical protein [Veillonella parvula]MBS6140173.1 hypothetical protein [Veillonella parvula]